VSGTAGRRIVPAHVANGFVMPDARSVIVVAFRGRVDEMLQSRHGLPLTSFGV
jgi:hypothetical protein